MSHRFWTRAGASLAAGAVILAGALVAPPAYADDAPAADPTATPSAPAAEPTGTPTPQPADTPSVEVDDPAVVTYGGRVTRTSEQDVQDLLSGPQLFSVSGQGYLRVDLSRVGLGADILDLVTLRFAVPQGLVPRDGESEFDALSRVSMAGAPLIAVERVASRLGGDRATSSRINQGPAQPATHQIYAVRVAPNNTGTDGGTPGASDIQTDVAYADDYWNQQSSGSVRFHLAGVSTWYKSTYSCATDSGSTSLWSQAATKARDQLGYQPGPNTHLVLFFPSTANCGDAVGLGTVGWSVNEGGLVWAIGATTPYEQDTLAHELGHNLTLGHAGWLDCPTSNPHPGTFGNSDGCGTEKYYGDYVDVMGFGAEGKSAGALSSPGAIRSGIWPSSAYVYAPTGTNSYTINSLSSNTGLRSVVLEDSNGVNYFVEFRNATGEDAQYSPLECDASACGEYGVRVLRLEYQPIDFGDFTAYFKGMPGDDSLLVGRTVSGVDRVAYQAGESFNSGSSNPVIVNVTSVTADSATISVTRPSANIQGQNISVAVMESQDASRWLVGDVLSALLWSDWYTTAVNFQWYRQDINGFLTAIPGATSQNYTLQAADVGYFLVARAWQGSSNDAYDPDPDYYYGYGPVEANVSAGSVGVTRSGSTLTAAPSGWSAAGGVSYAYRWFRQEFGGDTPIAIAGATASTYTLTSADQGYDVAVRVTGTRKSTTGKKVVFSEFRDYFVLGDAPAIAGAPQVGHQLSVGDIEFSTADGVVAPAVSYQWKRNGTAIAGATGAAYDLVGADDGKTLSVTVTAALPGYISYAKTASAGVIAKGVIGGSYAIPTVAVDTSAYPKLTAALPAGSITEPGTTTAWQWLRNGAAISGATSAAYTLTSADAGKLVSVRATVSKAGYLTVGPLTSPTVNYGLTASGTLAIGGVLKVGAVLEPTALGYAVASGAPVSPTLAYQWLRDGTTISGATGATYALTSNDYGRKISVRVTATLPGAIPLAVTSAATAAIGSGAIADYLAPVVTHPVGSLVLTSQLPAESPVESGVAVSYQWYRGSSAISGATKISYTLTSADYAKQISVRWTIKKANYASIVRSSAPVDYSVTPSAPPAITGTVRVGLVLTAVVPTYSAGGDAAPLTPTIQWLRDGAAISGATGGSYTVVAADYGKKISVKITGAWAGFVTSSVASAATAKVVKGTITGSVAVTPNGTGLLATPTVSETGVKFAYQWYRGSTAITGATKAAYTLASADAGKQLKVRVTVTKSGYTTLALNSTPANYALVASGAPTIAGEVVIGQPLTATAPTYTYLGGAASPAVVLQWMRAGAAISGATGPTYTPTAADKGKTISVRATATLAGAVKSVTTSAATPAVGQYSLAGWNAAPTAAVTSTSPLTLTATPGVTETGAKFAYQWYRGSSAISKATAVTYKPTSSDYGKLLSVRVVATKADFTPITAKSAPTGYSLLVASAPVLTGSAELGSTLSVGTDPAFTDPSGSPVAPATVAYQWLRNGSAISGATAASYAAVAADVGKKLSVRITATSPGLLPATTTSAQTGAVAKYTVASATKPTITGDPAVGSPVGLAPRSYTLNGAPITATVSYQWLRSGAAISGATSETYAPVAADRGKTISVKVTAAFANATSLVVTSAATQPLGDAVLAGWDSVATFAMTAPATLTLGDVQTGITEAGAVPAYQWLRGGSAISGATKATYKLTSSDYGKAISVRVTTTKSGFTRAVQTTAATSFSVAATGTAAISGTAKTGQTLTAVAPAYTTKDGAVTPPLTWQWYRSGTAISGATAQTYHVGSSDYGKKLTVKITTALPGFLQVAKTSASTATVAKGTAAGSHAAPIVAHAPPSLVLTASLPAGSVTEPGVTYAYQWLRGGAAISGATKTTYTLASADAGKAISVRVTVTRTNFAALTLTSAAADYSIAAGSAPTIGGTVRVGATLSAGVPSFTALGDPPSPTVGYQWLRGGAAIAGATAPDYQLTADDYGKAISLRVTATIPGYVAWTGTTAATAPVALGVIQGSLAAPTISQDGAQLAIVLTLGSLTEDSAVLGYRWYRGAEAIPFAYGATYQLTDADSGQEITAVVRVTKPGYSTVTLETEGAVYD